jgi:hypothetical protein
MYFGQLPALLTEEGVQKENSSDKKKQHFSI